jgi:vancomycin permeability regulator SanA
MEFKTGNIISVFLFGLLIFFAIISLLRSTNFGGVASFVLITFSGVSFFSLIYSDLQIQKEVKIVAIAVNLLSTVFILSSVIMISISGRGELKFIRTLLIFLLICALGIFSVFLNVLNFDDDSILYSANDRSADSGVILGAAVWGGNRPSPVLKERIVKGFEIYRRKIVPKLVITGGGSPNELTEGEVSKNELIKFGVEPANLILENSSNSTIEQIHFVRDNLYNKNSWDKIILISDNFHLLRSKEISSFNNINADCIASDKELSAGGTASFCMKESLALIVFWMSGV